MNNTWNYINQRMSLRKPLGEALDVVEKLTDTLSLKKCDETNREQFIKEELQKAQTVCPYCRDFERDFPSFSFSIATGIGKTRLMGACIAYLYLKKKIRNFFILAPNLPIYEKLIRDFGEPSYEKYVFKGISEFVLKQAINDMLTAYKNFFERHNGYPKFKSKHDNKQSCRFELGAISKRNDYTTYHLSLANIRNVKFRCNEKYAQYLQKHHDNIRQATLTRLPCGEYHLSILVDGDLVHKVKETNAVVGIDLGVKDFVITSDGEVFDNLHFKKSESKKIKRLQRQLSKKQKGSNNRNKARVRLAKIYKRINDKKQYYLHAVSNSLIDENQVICMEDLNVKGMVKNHNLAESICEMNFGEFRRMLEYKANWYNRKIVFVDRFYPSSKTCHNCSYINKDLKLSDRQWICPQCGEVIERDYNAALNILDEGLKIMGNRVPN